MAKARAVQPDVANAQAALSVSANIAEGCGKNSAAELARHARNSLGSASELSYYLTVAHDLSYVDGPERDALQSGVIEVRRMLASLERAAATSPETAIPTSRLHRKRTHVSFTLMAAGC